MEELPESETEIWDEDYQDLETSIRELIEAVESSTVAVSCTPQLSDLTRHASQLADYHEDSVTLRQAATAALATLGRIEVLLDTTENPSIGGWSQPLDDVRARLRDLESRLT